MRTACRLVLIASAVGMGWTCAHRTDTVPAWRAVEFLHRSGLFCSEPCDFSLYVRVEPRDDNRELWVTCAAAEGVERTAAIELTEQSPATQDRFLFLGLTAGEYVCQAVVLRVDGSTRMDETRIKVLGRTP